MIEESKKQYYHFLLGGILTKEVIYKKLSELLNKLKNEKDELKYCYSFRFDRISRNINNK